MSTRANARHFSAIAAAIITICLLLSISTTSYATGFGKYTVQTGQEAVTNAVHGSHGNAQHTFSKEHGQSDDTDEPKVKTKPSDKPTDEKPKEKLAYVTWLSGTIVDDDDEDLENDIYFQATRILVWQLLHVPETRTKDIDVVVMVTPSVSESRRARLQRDGAIVYPVELLASETRWEHGLADRWNDIMTKLRVWQMTQYSRILFLDGDMMLLSSLDGVFDDPAAQIQETKQMDNYTAVEGEGPLPSTYLFASLSEVDNIHHDFPPTYDTGIRTKGY